MATSFSARERCTQCEQEHNIHGDGLQSGQSFLWGRVGSDEESGGHKVGQRVGCQTEWRQRLTLKIWTLHILVLSEKIVVLQITGI